MLPGLTCTRGRQTRRAGSLPPTPECSTTEGSLQVVPSRLASYVTSYCQKLSFSQESCPLLKGYSKIRTRLDSRRCTPADLSLQLCVTYRHGHDLQSITHPSCHFTVAQYRHYNGIAFLQELIIHRHREYKHDTPCGKNENIHKVFI